MKDRFALLFAPAKESSGQSGGRGQGGSPAAAAADPVAGERQPVSKLKAGVFVTLHFGKDAAKDVRGFRDPVFGFCDQRGVRLASGMVPDLFTPES